MKFTSEIIKEAHKLTREIKTEYREVDYRTQFGICLSYLLSGKEGKEMNNNKIYDFKQFKIIAKWDEKVVYNVEFEGDIVDAILKYGKMKGENITYLEANDINKNILIKGCGVDRTIIFDFESELIKELAKDLTMNDVRTIKKQGRIFNKVELDSKFRGLENKVAALIVDKDIELKATKSEIPNGYFRCWECGSIEPLYKKLEDGTCGC